MSSSTLPLRYGDRLLWKNEWHAVANVTPTSVWLISLERRNALPFLAEGLNG